MKKPRRKGVKMRAIAITALGFKILRAIERGTYTFSKQRGGRKRGRK